MATLQRRERDGVAWWGSPELVELGIVHGFSTRRGGVSEAPFDSLNLGRAGGVPLHSSDPPANRAENLRRFQSALGIGGRRVARVHQVHGAVVVDADALERRGADLAERTIEACEPRGAEPRERADPHPAVRQDPQADALVSATGDAALMVTIADCAPVLLACARSGVIAAVHAGWRGVVAGVVGAAIDRMAALGADRAEIRAAIGPCIGVAAFEVGEEVAAAFSDLGLGDAVRPRAGARPTIDLAGAVERQLRAAGVAARHVDRGEHCTVADRDDFFSYRRDGARGGRMAALIARM